MNPGKGVERNKNVFVEYWEKGLNPGKGVESTWSASPLGPHLRNPGKGVESKYSLEDPFGLNKQNPGKGVERYCNMSSNMPIDG